MDEAAAALAERLPVAVCRGIPDAHGLAALSRLSGGASQEIWSFDALTPAGPLPLILRRARHWSEAGQAGSAGMAAEAALLRIAGDAGVPAPAVRCVLEESDRLGEGYVMNRVPGESSARKILRHALFHAVRSRLARECGAIMARIHCLPLAQLPALRTGWALDEQRHWLAAHRANGTLRPVFELALRWLADHAPAALPAPALVHGDFRNGNLIVGAEGVRAVLDWELAHLGDPMEDLGWFCVNSWRFGNVEQPAGGFGSREELYAGYEAEGGMAVDPERVRYWEVMGTLKWGVSCDAMGLAYRRGGDRSIERLVIGRRTSETEIDLLALLASRPQEAM